MVIRHSLISTRAIGLTIVIVIAVFFVLASSVRAPAQVIIRSEGNTARIDCGVDIDKFKVEQISSLSLKATAYTPRASAITIKTDAGVVLAGPERGTCTKTTVCGATWPIKTLQVGENAVTAEAIDAVTGCRSSVTVFVDK